MRLGELCALELEDVEAMFLKIHRGKGAKFRRVPVSHRLRRELLGYVNRMRPDTPARTSCCYAMADPWTLSASPTSSSGRAAGSASGPRPQVPPHLRHRV